MDISKPAISVCIPTYERYANVLEQAIESILEQTFADFEIVISDNCSSYDIYQRLSKYKDGRIRIYKQSENIGMVANFNECIRLSRGRIIKPLCDDDALHPECLRYLAAVNGKADFYMIRDKLWNGSGAICWWPAGAITMETMAAGLTKSVLKVDCISPTNIAFTRDLWEKLGPYPDHIKYSFDYYFTVRARCHYPHIIIKTPLCLFRRWDNSETVKNQDIFKNQLEMPFLQEFLWREYPQNRIIIARDARKRMVDILLTVGRCFKQRKIPDLRKLFRVIFQQSRFAFGVARI